MAGSRYWWAGAPGHPLLRTPRRDGSVRASATGAARQLLRDDLGGAAGLHAHAQQAVAGVHRPLLVADDEELGVLAELVDQAEEPVEVDVVEGGFDLVHHVER